ncbi:hypothetical protein [Bacillus wiedmannii]|nr:hypothetical protein [Bacillus wiedmannii]
MLRVLASTMARALFNRKLAGTENISQSMKVIGTKQSILILRV